ncbi:hypothetical protein F5146DRAFT_322435 [Armillaria mellea]|nr:hypothetical protein F5146DRAFT_322435 [Armillaria mellea]
MELDAVHLASSVLWAHLLRKDALPWPHRQVQTFLFHPLRQPTEQAHQLRILLHGTQAHVEMFSERVEKLAKGVDKAKQELGLTKTLFQREHELMNEMYNLVNRCQTEIQKMAGHPLF